MTPSLPIYELSCCGEEYKRIKKDGSPELEECGLHKLMVKELYDSTPRKCWYHKQDDDNVILWIKKIGCIGIEMSLIPALIVQIIKLYKYNPNILN